VLILPYQMHAKIALKLKTNLFAVAIWSGIRILKRYLDRKAQHKQPGQQDLTWKTYWVDLCGSTLRLYRDLSLNPDSGNYPPPSKVIGPTTTNEKKEAFLVLKKGASISIPTNDEFRPRKKSKKMDPPRNNVFKLQVINSNNSPVYFFEAPSKGSMYRWISKIEEGIGIADSPQNPSSSEDLFVFVYFLPDRRLKEAKLLALESRRYQNIAPELKYSDNKDDTDSGMEGDVEESSEFQEKPPPDPRLVKLLHQLRSKEELLELLGKGEKAFVGDSGEHVETLKPNETPKNYSFLVTKKLRQRGISLIVGSSSSEDDDDEDFSTAATLRPYSAFVPRKSTTVNFGIRPTNVHLRTATTDDLLRDYSSSNLTRSNACVTFKSLQGGPSCPENVPPINQRRTIQLYRGEKEGFGFTLQTYGIVQQNGEVEYMTFVLTVEEDGPAYMAGMRPGDIIITIENRDVEEADHKTLVELLQKSSSTVRMVVVFVDAIRRMHLNTKIKVLRTELYNREEEFKHLCKREREILTRNGDP
ncbi:hypothetical protein QZH41_015505, partial [Actinostola sp. cb2023]